jgi:hypothetical protein
MAAPTDSFLLSHVSIFIVCPKYGSESLVVTYVSSPHAEPPERGNNSALLELKGIKRVLAVSAKIDPDSG